MRYHRIPLGILCGAIVTACGGGGGASSPSAAGSAISPVAVPAIAVVADAGEAASVTVGCTAALSGAKSKGDYGRTLSYTWALTSRPAGSAVQLTNTGSQTTGFVPDMAGAYAVTLRVSDGATVGTSEVLITASASSTPCGYRLVWADEFDAAATTLPDPVKWDYDTAQNAVGWYNNELQYYARARLSNSSVNNGTLKITALQEDLSTALDWGQQHYTSARLITRGKAAWTYGFFEIRAKLPCSPGSWPAIWTLGSTTNQWPAQGEIDIMEQTGMNKSVVLGTVHTPSGFGGSGSTGSTSVVDSCTAFHKYQILWTADAIRFLVDGREYRAPYLNPRTGASAWPFDLPQYLILNVAVGGVLGGSVVNSVFPMIMEVDYVRVYQSAASGP